MCILRRREQAVAREKLRQRRWRYFIAIVAAILIIAITFSYFYFCTEGPLSKKNFFIKKCSDKCSGMMQPPSGSDTSNSDYWFNGETLSDSDDGSVAVIGGADEPTNVVISDNQSETENDFGTNLYYFFTNCGGALVDRQVSDADTDEYIDEDNEIKAISWDVAPDDDAYMKLMGEKLEQYIDYMTQLSSMRTTLSGCKNVQKVKENEKYNVLYASIVQWCGAAKDYPASSLYGEEAKEVRNDMIDMAAATLQYMELYPSLVCAEKSAEKDVKRADALLETMLSYAVELDGKLNG